ncbi:PREDICTED: protein PAXX [Nanorana parkeri]|uniref:protein PAXX n=1 Tax=Nanorana parkeri TaxID=125878 RepID=UPI000854883E|nr:PREDICTED: protein PAXX [Nanorana parkeri]
MEDTGQWLPLCILKNASHQYFSHCRAPSESGRSLQVEVTNGIEAWRLDAAEEALEEWDAVRNLTSQDLVTKLRETFQHSTPVLDMQGSLASLSILVNSGKVTFDLLKLPVSEARAHVHQVLISLTDRIWNLEKQLKAAETNVASSSSPVKQSQHNHFLPIPDVDARKKGSAGQVKKRMLGESLINPGCKSKKIAKGVDFEES